MKNLKLTILSVIIAVSGLLLGIHQAGAAVVLSGTSCAAANLNQALQGMGWSQGGVVNNSSNPLFVACPLIWDGAATQNTVWVVASFPGSGSIDCTMRNQFVNDGSYESTTLNIASAQNTSSPNTGLSGIGFTRSGGTINATVVCALDPGEGVQGYWYQ